MLEKRRKGFHYFDTTNLKDEELKMYNAQAYKQEDLVMYLIEEFEDSIASPSMIWNRMNTLGRKIPLTSVRRAMTVLTRNGHLMRLHRQVKGEYGKSEYMWQRVTDNYQYS
tara:strand:+ start:189 stop:521 length:333 start_codon:yes stop_codon:yes gene_type:complete